MGKYDLGPKDEFNDPIVRCTECQAIVYRADIYKIGMCPNCGNRRVRSISVLSGDEMQDLKDKNVDPEYLALFAAEVT